MDSRLDQISDPMNDILGQDSGDEFESIPLPNQLPRSSSFQAPVSNAESSTIKSRTVQTLLSQNQDLMARLTVALKRNIELEQKVESQEDIYHSLSGQYDILKDQSNVTLEKNKHLEFENQKLYDQSTAIEKRFAELYAAYQSKVDYIQKLSYRLHRFIQYRKRIKGYVRPLITHLKAEVVDLKNQILVLNEQGIKQLEFINDLKKKYSDAIDRIQAINTQFDKTQMDLTQYHEVRYQGISSELETLKIEAEALRTHNIDLKNKVENLTENEASLSNKSIFFERKYSDLKNEFEQISQEFIQQKTLDNTQLTRFELQLKDLKAQVTKTSEERNALANENRTLNDQLQSLQLIYQDNLTKIEDLEKKYTAQDQINKELSQSLLESRKKSEHLEEKLVLAEEEFKRKLQAFQVRFNKVPTEPLSIIQAAEQTKSGQKDLLNKIQNLLSEIQTGHSHIADKVSFAPTNEPGELISEFGDIE
jgi:chromosome segregation ATPase